MLQNKKTKRRTIKQKQYRTLIFMIVTMSLIASAGIICIQILRQTSDEIVIEYYELNSVQELKFAFHKLLTTTYLIDTDKTVVDKNELEKLLKSTYEKLYICKNTLTKSHGKNQLLRFENDFTQVRLILIHSLINEITKLDNAQLITLIDDATVVLESLLHETEDELDEYININKTAAIHSSISITALSFFLIIISSLWGSRLVIKISKNIQILSKSTDQVAKGNLSINTEINSNDEIGDLGNSFNKMVSTLNKTTVSKDFFDNIIKSMIESLFVTDVNGNIILVNQATLDLLGYSRDELINQNYDIILVDQKSFNITEILLLDDTHIAMHNHEANYKLKSGEQIPVLLSCSKMDNKEKGKLGIVFVAHDIRNKRQIEQQLISARNEQIIAINEAQEKERLKLASEIHDGLGQTLTGISFSIENYLTNKFNEDKEYENHVLKIQEQLNTAISEAKSIAYNLIPIAIKDFGLVVAINNLVQQINSVEKININFNVYNYEERIDERIEKALYRIIQEALNNVIKHSKSNTVNIQLVKYDDTLSLVIEDDGIGFKYDEMSGNDKQSGIGLISMKERVSGFNGNFIINSSLNKGTEILIDIPCKNVNISKK